MEKKLCFNLFVPPGKKEIVLGTKVDEATKRRLDRIVDAEDRTISYVMRELMLRGLAMYEADGVLRSDHAVKEPAKVVARISPAQHSKADIQHDLEKGLPYAEINLGPKKKRKAG